MPAPADRPEDVLEREQAHLDTSRAALHAMREATTRNFAQAVGGNSVSTQHLKQILYRRMRALEDDPDLPLFFGRLDYDRALGAELDETLYIGRRHVSGELGGDPLVMDWRAPLAVPFYRASPLDPMGVAWRRRFGFSHGRLTAYEDEELGASARAARASTDAADRPNDGDAPRADLGSQLLQDEIERPRTGPMRDIVATIQPDQDVLVRSQLAESLCIQGAPGTGKTAVGLHRAAYLLYAFREQLSRSGVAVIGPNDQFLSYIGDVLPALGEIDARSETIGSLLAEATGAQVRGTEDAAVAILKGDARMATVLANAVWGSLRTPQEGLVVPRGSRQIRVSPSGIEAAMDAVRTLGVRYEAGRLLLAQRLAHEGLLFLESLGDTTDDRVQNAVARHAATRATVEQAWPKLAATRVLHRLYTDPGHLASCADGVLTADEQASLQPAKAPKSAAAVRWTLADLALLDELGDLLNRTPSLGHVIVDEAQDLSPMMLRAVGRRASTGSLTVLGDLAQATAPWGATDWPTALGHLGRPDARVTELVEGFRVPGAVIDLAARLLPSIAPGLTPPRSVRRSRGELALIDAPVALPALADAVRAAAERAGTVGVIVPDAAVSTVAQALANAGLPATELGRDASFEAHIEIVPAGLAKGLEFDHVVLLEPAAIVEGEADERTGLRRLYVCLTRAVTSLAVVHARALPGALAA